MGAEYSLPPPDSSLPAPEYRVDPQLEFTPLPPEYGQRTTPDPTPEKKRRLRKLLAVPAILLLCFLCVHIGGSGYVKPSTAPDDLPKGSVVIDVIDSYTNVEDDTVNYRYQLYLRDASGDTAFGDPAMPWPIEVYASVTDEDGNTVASAENPDVWIEGRSLGNHSIGVKELKGGLILKLRAEYTQEGEKRQTTIFVSLSRDPGTNMFMIDYAMLDPATRRVEFDYWIERSGYEPSLPVDATIIDSEGRTAHPSLNPVLWSSDPNLDPNCKWADASDLNDNLTLILRCEYTAQDGKQYEITASRQVVIIGKSADFPDYAPDTSAQITGISRTSVSFKAELKTTYESGSYYDMVPNSLALVWLDKNSNELHRDYVREDGIQSEKSFDPAKSPPWGEWPDWTFTYDGAHRFYDTTMYDYDADAVKNACYVYAELTLHNRYTGRRYTICSDSVPAPGENYPLGSGQIALTVYNDTTTFEFPSAATADGYLTVLDQKTIAEADFVSYTLPSPMTPSGYTFAGWVIHVGNPFDNGGSTESLKGYNGDPPVDLLVTPATYAFAVGNTLTSVDIEKVAPSADGKRYVNVHAVWIETNPSQKLLRLDDGMGNVTEYGSMLPLASEGYLYLCRYPEPTREGYTFDGWYDSSGKRVDMLVCFFSFTPVVYDENGNFAGYDWTQSGVVTLTAHWK